MGRAPIAGTPFMLAAVLALLLSTAQAQPTVPWGEHEWRNGVGQASEHYFHNGTGFGSAWQLDNGTRAGSFYFLAFGTGPGSSHFWSQSVEAGSAYFWRNGLRPGSRYYWFNGRGCLSEFGWRNGAACSGPELLTFQALCIAGAVDVAPCGAINRRLDDWLQTSSGLSTGDLGAVVREMRQALD